MLTDYASDHLTLETLEIRLQLFPPVKKRLKSYLLEFTLESQNGIAVPVQNEFLGWEYELRDDRYTDAVVGSDRGCTGLRIHNLNPRISPEFRGSVENILDKMRCVISRRDI